MDKMLAGVYHIVGYSYNVRHSYETDIKLKFCEISFVYKLRFNGTIVLKIVALALLCCTKFPNEWTMMN